MHVKGKSILLAALKWRMHLKYGIQCRGKTKTGSKNASFIEIHQVMRKTCQRITYRSKRRLHFALSWPDLRIRALVKFLPEFATSLSRWRRSVWTPVWMQTYIWKLWAGRSAAPVNWNTLYAATISVIKPFIRQSQILKLVQSTLLTHCMSQAHEVLLQSGFTLTSLISA